MHASAPSQLQARVAGAGGAVPAGERPALGDAALVARPAGQAGADTGACALVRAHLVGARAVAGRAGGAPVAGGATFTVLAGKVGSRARAADAGAAAGGVQLAGAPVHARVAAAAGVLAGVARRGGGAVGEHVGRVVVEGHVILDPQQGHVRLGHVVKVQEGQVRRRGLAGVVARNLLLLAPAQPVDESGQRPGQVVEVRLRVDEHLVVPSPAAVRDRALEVHVHGLDAAAAVHRTHVCGVGALDHVVVGRQDDTGRVELVLLEDVGRRAHRELTARAEGLTAWLDGVRVSPRFPSPACRPDARR